MTTIIPVKFKYSLRELWFDPKETGAREADHVVVTTERGTEIGLAVGDPCEVDDETLEATIGTAPLQNVLRIATEADLAHAEHLAELGEKAMPIFRKHVHESGLDMKPVGVEYLFGGEKVVCYFAAEDRVDFRQLVRELSHELHARIDMRQIGVREEAAIVGGYGHCGQELCCRRFGHEFQPVSIRMAKEQDLPLNSSKISGACGRLMCCLRYEFEAYRDFKSRAPKRNAVIDTPLGKAKIVEYDTPKEELLLRVENGKSFRVPLKDMTASEAACKKSEELGCACRPDTVTRAVLDKLDSPDIQMALAELDREHGVLPPEPTLPEADILPETKRRRRRAESKTQGQDSAHMVKVEIPDGSPAPATPKPRRRRKVRMDAPQQASEAASQERMSAGEASSRTRRRHHHVEGAPEASQEQQKQPKQKTEQPHPQRRRHAAPEQGEGAAAGNGPRRTRRRPGDRGGQAQDAQKGRGSRQEASSQKGSGKDGASRPKHLRPEGQKGGERPRRRHRSGGKGQGGAEPSSGAPSAE